MRKRHILKRTFTDVSATLLLTCGHLRVINKKEDPLNYELSHFLIVTPCYICLPSPYNPSGD